MTERSGKIIHIEELRNKRNTRLNQERSRDIDRVMEKIGRISPRIANDPALNRAVRRLLIDPKSK